MAIAHGERLEAFDELDAATAAMHDQHAFYGSGGDEAELQRRFTELMESCARFGAAEGIPQAPAHSLGEWNGRIFATFGDSDVRTVVCVPMTTNARWTSAPGCVPL